MLFKIKMKAGFGIHDNFYLGNFLFQPSKYEGTVEDIMETFEEGRGFIIGDLFEASFVDGFSSHHVTANVPTRAAIAVETIAYAIEFKGDVHGIGKDFISQDDECSLDEEVDLNSAEMQEAKA